MIPVIPARVSPARRLVALAAATTAATPFLIASQAHPAQAVVITGTSSTSTWNATSHTVSTRVMSPTITSAHVNTSAALTLSTGTTSRPTCTTGVVTLVKDGRTSAVATSARTCATDRIAATVKVTPAMVGGQLSLAVTSVPAANKASFPGTASVKLGAATTTSVSTTVRSSDLDEQFTTAGTLSPSGRMQVNGYWTGTYGNILDPANTRVSGGQLTLTSIANQKQGAEVQTVQSASYGTGYYETRMKPTAVPGVVTSYFFISKGYQPPEVDIEFTSKDKYTIWCSVHMPNGVDISDPVKLPFNPADGFHTYGMLIGTNSVSWFADRKLIKTATGLPTNLGSSKPLDGYVMANSWAGNVAWAGPLPTSNTVTTYDWMRAWKGVTAPMFS